MTNKKLLAKRYKAVKRKMNIVINRRKAACKECLDEKIKKEIKSLDCYNCPLGGLG